MSPSRPVRRGGGWFALALIALLPGCGDGTKDPEDFSAAEQLAALDGEFGDVSEYEDALLSLNVRCTETHERIGDMVVTAQGLYADQGQVRDLIDIMRDGLAATAGLNTEVACSDVFAGLVVLSR